MTLTYKILSNGYEIYRDNMKWISQTDNFSKLFVPDGTYEDNAKAHIAEIEEDESKKITIETRMTDAENSLAEIAATILG